MTKLETKMTSTKNIFSSILYCTSTREYYVYYYYLNPDLIKVTRTILVSSTMLTAFLRPFPQPPRHRRHRRHRRWERRKLPLRARLGCAAGDDDGIYSHDGVVDGVLSLNMVPVEYIRSTRTYLLISFERYATRFYSCILLLIERAADAPPSSPQPSTPPPASPPNPTIYPLTFK